MKKTALIIGTSSYINEFKNCSKGYTGLYRTMVLNSALESFPEADYFCFIDKQTKKTLNFLENHHKVITLEQNQDYLNQNQIQNYDFVELQNYCIPCYSLCIGILYLISKGYNRFLFAGIDLNWNEGSYNKPSQHQDELKIMSLKLFLNQLSERFEFVQLNKKSELQFVTKQEVIV